VLWNSVVGDTFHILSDVRQESVLSPFLFLIYLDDVMGDLKKSRYGLHIGVLFIGCIIVLCMPMNDDTMPLSCSCHGV